MRILTTKTRTLTLFLVFGFLFCTVLCYGQSELDTLPQDSLGFPDSFIESIPPEMEKWYDDSISNGEIHLNVRDSEANWDDFTPGAPHDSAPNILFILYDDTGLGAWSPYGGGIKMPTLDALAQEGLTYTQWHTTALCSPTRSTILTGRNHHLNGMASITETADGYPGSNGRVPEECMSFAQVLQDNGYSTFWIGKNHNVPESDVAPGGYRGEWPCQIGFDRFYGFLGGETNNWYPDLVEDNHFIEAPYTPAEGYHLSKDLADQSIKMLKNQNASNPSKPWYMWFCPGANHAPHHSPPSYTKMYIDEGTFKDGYDVYRKEIFERMDSLHIFNNKAVDTTALNFLPDSVANELDHVIPWDDLDSLEQDLYVRMAEVYAGFSTYTDVQIGRIIDYLKESEQYENTIIIYAADNGASGEGTPVGSVNENKFFNGYPDLIEDNIKYMDVLGTPATYNHFPTGWAAAFSTPFKMFKRYSQFAGGTNDPLIISWPKYMDSTGVSKQNLLRHQYHHSVDIVPTLLDAIGLSMPDTASGVIQQPLSGKSMLYTFDNIVPDYPTEKEIQYYSMLGTRGIWKNGWKAIALHAPTSGVSNFDDDVWELYNVENDRAEAYNLVDPTCSLYNVIYLDTLKSLINAWFSEAAKNNVLPLDDRIPPELIGVERPNPEPEKDEYTYYPYTTAVPEGVAVNIRGSSYTITADVEITQASKGVIFAHGSRFGGHTLYIKDNKLRYFYNFLGVPRESNEFESDSILPTGNYIVSADFILNQDDTENDPIGSGIGTLNLYVNGALVATGPMKTQPAKFTLSGDGLCVGYDSADAITSEYETVKGQFEGGYIRSVVVRTPPEEDRIINRKAAARRMMLRQ